MIWLIKKNESHQVISCNTSKKEKGSELWVTRPNGKTLKVYEGEQEEVELMKEAIDFAISKGVPTFSIE